MYDPETLRKVLLIGDLFDTSMEDSTSSQTSVLNCASSTSVQNVVFRCEYLFYYWSEMNDNDGTFSQAPGTYVLHEILFHLHEKL